MGSMLLPAPTGQSWPAGMDMAASARSRCRVPWAGGVK